MARHSTAYTDFAMRLSEVEHLRAYAAQKEAEDAVKHFDEINAFCRGSIVLLCGHLEAYIKELGEVALDALHAKAVPRNVISLRLFYHISKEFLDEIQDTEDPERIAAKVFGFLNNDSAQWSQVGPFPSPISADRFSKGFANPAYDKIKAYFGRFGYTAYAHDVATVLKRQFEPTRNTVNHLVDIRNMIAHGDPSATKTPGEVLKVTETIDTFCKVTDDVFCSWCSASLCSIR
jgi:hypothetical protein